jgi:hypothetical protein
MIRHAVARAFLGATLCVSIPVAASCATSLTAQQAAAQDAIVVAQRGKPDTAAFDAIYANIRSVCGGQIRPECATKSAKLAMTDLLRATIPCASMPPQSEHTSGTSPDSADSEEGYLPGVIDTVRQLHDPSSIPVLYNAYILATGGIAIQALAYFGRTEAPHIIYLYEHDHSLFVHTAYSMVILSMLAQKTVSDAATMRKIEQIMLTQSVAGGASDRELAVEALSYFTDEAARARLTEISLHDPEIYVPALTKKPQYVIREKAVLALQHPFTIYGDGG